MVNKSHFYARFLARNWEKTPGHLRVFRFDTGRIHRSSAKSSFISPEPFSPEVERLLGLKIETPLGEYIARCPSATGHVVPAGMSEREDRALVLALFTQSARTAHAQGNEDAGWLAALLGDDEKSAELVRGARTLGQIAGANLISDDLLLPSTGIVALPLAGLHGWMLPLTPTAFVAFVPKESSIDALDRVLGTKRLLTLLSVGIEGDVVAVPPRWNGSDGEIAKWIVAARGFARAFNQGAWDANVDNLPPNLRESLPTG